MVVSPGSIVRQGQLIGYVGSTGPHLHYEVYRGGVAVNPMGEVPQPGPARGAELERFRARVQQLMKVGSPSGS